MGDKSAWDMEGIERSESMARISRSPTLKDYLLMSNVGNWPILPVFLTCLAVFAIQAVGFMGSLLAGHAPDLNSFAFSAQAMAEGRYYSLFTALFMHAGIYHIWANMATYVATAPLVAARFGKGWKAMVPFNVFYLLCGVAGNLLFWLIHPHGVIPLVGASGAIYGVIAALMRLDIQQDALAPVFSKKTLKALWFLLYSNVIVILIFGGPSVLVDLVQGKTTDIFIPIAWEAHLGGFMTGFFLIGVMAGRSWPGPWRAGIMINPADEMLDGKNG